MRKNEFTPERCQEVVSSILKEVDHKLIKKDRLVRFYKNGCHREAQRLIGRAITNRIKKKLNADVYGVPGRSNTDAVVEIALWVANRFWIGLFDVRTAFEATSMKAVKKIMRRFGVPSSVLTEVLSENGRWFVPTHVIQGLNESPIEFIAVMSAVLDAAVEDVLPCSIINYLDNFQFGSPDRDRVFENMVSTTAVLKRLDKDGCNLRLSEKPDKIPRIVEPGGKFQCLGVEFQPPFGFLPIPGSDPVFIFTCYKSLMRRLERIRPIFTEGEAQMWQSLMLGHDPCHVDAIIEPVRSSRRQRSRRREVLKLIAYNPSLLACASSTHGQPGLVVQDLNSAARLAYLPGSLVPADSDHHLFDLSIESYPFTSDSIERRALRLMAENNKLSENIQVEGSRPYWPSPLLVDEDEAAQRQLIASRLWKDPGALYHAWERVFGKKKSRPRKKRKKNSEPVATHS